MKRAWMILAAMGLVALSASPLRAQSTRDLVGKDPPAIVANSWINSDKPLTLDELKGKKIVLVQFFMVKCPHCVVAAPQLRRLQENYEGDGLVILSVSNDPPDKIKAFLDENQLKSIVAVDTNWKTSLEYNIQGVPWSFMVGANGKIVWQGDPRSVDEVQLQSELMDLKPAKTAEEKK